MLALAPIRKSKGQTVSLLILLTVAGTLLYLGLSLSLNVATLFEKKAEELGSPDAVMALQDTIYTEADADFFRGDPRVLSVETVRALAFPHAEADYAGNALSLNILLLGENTLAETRRFVGEKLPDAENPVYLPNLFRTGGGFRLGDEFNVRYGGAAHTFTVAGFFEDIHLGYINIGITTIVLPDPYAFGAGLENPPVPCTLILPRVHDKEDSVIINDFISEKMQNTNPASLNNAFFSGTWFQNSKTASTLTVEIASGIMILFSLLIVIVGLIVVQFRIVNAIEDDMQNIGALKAAGYTSGQVIGGFLTQFLLVALVGCGLGVLLSQAVLPLISAAFATQSGLVWEWGFDASAAILALAIIAGTVLLTSLWATRRIQTLHPIIALRGGVTTHSFKKNRFPLDKARGGLWFLLAMKAMHLKQSVSIALICAAVTFASAVFTVLYYNVGVEDTAFIELVMNNYCDAYVDILPEANPQRAIKEIRAAEGVKKAVFYSSSSAPQVGNRFVNVSVTENYNDLRDVYIYEGRSPKHSNEIAIGGVMASELGLTIGDKVAVSYTGETTEYFISGLGQNAENNGWTAQLTQDGVKRMNPLYQSWSVNVYAEEGTDLAVLCERLRVLLGNRASRVLSIEDETVRLDTYIDLIFLVTVLILSITALVIALVLYLTVKTSILRRRRALGIQKAVGYTTGQLTRQISAGFMPPVLCGVIAGGFFAGCFANDVFNVLFRSIGFMRVNFIVLPSLVAAIVALIGCFAYAVALTVSWRIRRINAYTLITE